MSFSLLRLSQALRVQEGWCHFQFLWSVSQLLVSQVLLERGINASCKKRWKIERLRCFIPKEQFAALIRAFITSRLDFCNSLYYRLPNNLITRIQTVQNACAKCLTGRKKYDSATQARMDLHWLPIRARASFKILVFAHRVVHSSSSPYYLSSAFSTTKHTRDTRNNRANTLKGTFDCRLTTVGARSIYITLRELWNSLPAPLREIESLPRYKANLKTHLFKLYYP